MHDPDEGFISILRESDGAGTPAGIWHEIYDENTNLLKESALLGLRRAIASRM